MNRICELVQELVDIEYRGHTYNGKWYFMDKEDGNRFSYLVRELQYECRHYKK